MSRDLYLRLPADMRSPGQARHSLDGLGRMLPGETLDRTRLLVTELVTNSVRHAPLSQDDRIDVRLHVADDQVRVEVVDPGTGFDQQEFDGPDDAERDGGWGLRLVDQMADRWGVERGRDTTNVWFEIEVPKERRKSA